jgi:hypothetical protein
MTAAQIAGRVIGGAANDDPLSEAALNRTIGAMEGGVFGGSADAACMLLADVMAWLKTAMPDAELVYATGHLPVWSKAPARMRAAAEVGLVALFQDRPKRGIKHYIAHRTAREWFDFMAPAALTAGHTRTDEENRLLDLLIECADNGHLCPSNAALAGELDLTDGLRASYLLGCLEKQGLITREPTDWVPGRIITIVATGKATAAIEGRRK